MTIIKHPHQRVALLIDTNNLYHSARSLYGRRVNFAALLETAAAGRELVRAVAYVVKSDSPEEETFFEALNDRGIETKTKDLQVFFDGSKKRTGMWESPLMLFGLLPGSMLLLLRVETGTIYRS
jgi:uncharacterized LabA/DUF88 family protein